jgi:hypothetical protein
LKQSSAGPGPPKIVTAAWLAPNAKNALNPAASPANRSEAVQNLIVESPDLRTDAYNPGYADLFIREDPD